MQIHPAEIVIAIQIVQALAALVLSGLLLYFFNSYRHAFLRHWVCSVLALAVYMTASAAALGLYWAGPAYDWARVICSGISLGAAYPHVVWLMLGTWEAVNERVVQRRLEFFLVGGTALFGILTVAVVPFDPEPAGLRNLLRVELRYFLTGAAFLIAGVLLWRAQHHSARVGPRIAAAGFCLFGLQMLHVVGVNLAGRAGYPSPIYASYMGLIDFLFQLVIALGIVVWLLELQQQRARSARNELKHMRLHDPTTGLPNREMLIAQIAEMIDRAGERRIAVVSLGMNRFTMLNGALGRQRTERMMRDVSLRVQELIGQGCALGRISDRDFVVVRPTLDEPDSICAWTESLLANAIRPVPLEQQQILVTFCAGISVYPDDAAEPELLLQHSQQALVQSAQIGRDVTLFQQLGERHHGTVEAVLRFESDLRCGLSERRFELYYQPIVAVSDARVTGFEALLRWRHPERGVLLPEEFLDEAATIGVLDQLESFALEAALFQLSQWHCLGRSGLKMAVNVSARRFQHDDLLEEVVGACHRFGVDPGMLELEITENTALRDLSRASRQITALREAGVSVALDDFGTGYSSLANLIKLPVDRIKLDRAFLADVLQNPRQHDMVAAMIELGHHLGLEVVAEGVESQAQLDFLAVHDCDLAQGYLLQRPSAPQQCRFEPAPVMG